MPRFRNLAGFLSLFLFAACLAAVEPIPLNDHTRLGQRLTATMPWNGVWLTAPSWLDAEGGFTLSLWDSPERETLLARKVFADIVDNARVELLLPERAKPGVLYWEIDQRTGTTRVGLYSDVLDQETGDCAYLDGKPDRKRRFHSGPIYSPGRRYENTADMIAALRGTAELADKIAACRELAAAGTDEAVPILACMLSNPQISHAARHALETMASPAADEALQESLDGLQGDLRVGVINSLGVRRDEKAVPQLVRFLRGEDQATAAAAAVALGRIGNEEAADGLEAVLTPAAEGIGPAVREGCLSCADALAARGALPRALRIFERLRHPEMPMAVREGALRGLLRHGAPPDPALLRELLRSPDLRLFRVALWALQRGVGDKADTETALAELATLPADRGALLAEALCCRRDQTAMPALIAALAQREPEIRLAVARHLHLFVGEAIVTPLLDALVDPDAGVRNAARKNLAELRAPAATAAALEASLLSALFRPEPARRAAVLELLGQRQVNAALPAVLKAAGDPDPTVRAAAFGTLRALAGTAEIPSLVQGLGKATEPAEQKAAEAALLAVCGRSGEAAVGALREALEQAPEALHPALLRALARTDGQEAFDAVASRLTDPREPIRHEAVQLVTGWRDRLAIPRVLELARHSQEEREHILAVRGLVRLAGPRRGEWDADAQFLAEAIALSRRPDEKRLALGVLADVPDRKTLAIAMRALGDEAVAKEAGAAAAKIAGALPRPGDSDIRIAMEQVLQRVQDADVRTQAENVLEKHRQELATIAQRFAGKLPERAPAAPLKPRRLLLYDANVVYGGHPARFVANDAFALMGRQTGAFEAVVSRDPEIFRPESLRQFDAVCFNSTVGLLFEDEALRQSLVEFVYAGGGLLGIHATTFAFIDWDGKRGDTWPEFGIMLGARGGSHGEGREHVFVKLDDPHHPLNAAFAGRDFEYRDEFFRVGPPYSRNRVRVLMSIDGQRTDLASHKLPVALQDKAGDYPLAWVRNYGRGRVFHCTIGHNSSVFEDKAMLEFYLGAIQFALGDLPAPALPSGQITPATRAWEKLGWRLGMTTYSLHKYTLFEAIDKTAELGLPYINGLCFQKVSGDIPKMFGPQLTDEEIRRVRLKLDEGHMRMLTHYIGDIPGDEGGCRNAFEFARKMGIETLLAEPKLEALDTIERFCDQYGINVGLHNHGEKQSPHYWHPSKIVEICQGRSKRIGACADVGYWIRSGIDPVEGVKILGDRLITIQMHDLHEWSPEGHDVPWGTGVGKVRELLAAIKELGVKPTKFGLEYSRDWFGNMPDMAKCIAFFNQVAIELAE